MDIKIGTIMSKTRIEEVIRIGVIKTEAAIKIEGVMVTGVEIKEEAILIEVDTKTEGAIAAVEGAGLHVVGTKNQILTQVALLNLRFRVLKM